MVLRGRIFRVITDQAAFHYLFCLYVLEGAQCAEGLLSNPVGRKQEKCTQSSLHVRRTFPKYNEYAWMGEAISMQSSTDQKFCLQQTQQTGDFSMTKMKTVFLGVGFLCDMTGKHRYFRDSFWFLTSFGLGAQPSLWRHLAQTWLR